MSLPRIRTSLRLTLLGALILLLLIPLFLVRGLVSERQGRAAQVKEEVSSKWGREQILRAPVLSVPLVKRTILKNGQIQTEERWLRFFPESLSIDADLATQIRRRSLFEVPVYTATVEMKGLWKPELPQDPSEGQAEWSRAVVSLDIGEARSLSKAPALEVAGAPVALDNTALEGGVAGFDLQAPTSLAAAKAVPFHLVVVQRGTERLSIAPEAASTQARLRSDWRSPSFQGAFLPDESQIAATGFDATWSISGLNLGTPLKWEGDEVPQVQPQEEYASSTWQDGQGHQHPYVPLLSVSLVEPVDGYDSVDRSLKFGILVIGLVFLALFLFEAFLDRPLHLVQYGLVGLALALFYLLLLSLSEHLGFDAAWAIASAATTGLVAGYAASVLAGWLRGGVLGAGLVALWGFLYTLLKAEDWSLLMGATGLFLILAATMWATRRIDWNRRDAEPSDA